MNYKIFSSLGVLVSIPSIRLIFALKVGRKGSKIAETNRIILTKTNRLTIYLPEVLLASFQGSFFYI